MKKITEYFCSHQIASGCKFSFIFRFSFS